LAVELMAFKRSRVRLLLRRLRLPTDLSSVVVFAVAFACDATRRGVLYYRPDEERTLSEWHVREVRGPLRRF
jgi:hypothetical protein